MPFEANIGAKSTSKSNLWTACCFQGICIGWMRGTLVCDNSLLPPPRDLPTYLPTNQPTNQPHDSLQSIITPHRTIEKPYPPKRPNKVGFAHATLNIVFNATGSYLSCTILVVTLNINLTSFGFPCNNNLGILGLQCYKHCHLLSDLSSKFQPIVTIFITKY